jgi:hypothetical protein
MVICPPLRSMENMGLTITDAPLHSAIRPTPSPLVNSIIHCNQTLHYQHDEECDDAEEEVEEEDVGYNYKMLMMMSMQNMMMVMEEEKAKRRWRWKRKMVVVGSY